MCGATYAALWNPYQYGHRRFLERACSYKLGIASSVDSTGSNAEEALMPRIHCYFLLSLFPFSALGQVPVPVTSAPNVTTTPKAPNTASAALAAIPQEKQNGRPRIGVALEGGGALGLAHIGVLEWFEEHHIPVDYVAGTSMGGLVGGLYATGKTPDELQQIVEQQNWDVIIGGKTPYEDLSYRRKEDVRDYPTSIRLGLKKWELVPAGLNAGHQIS